MGQNPVEVKDLFEVFDENFVLTSLTHSADVVLLDADGVAENVSPFSTGDAGATSNRERPSATEVAQADVVEFVSHLLCFHWEKSIRKIVPGQEIFSDFFFKDFP